MKTRNDLFVLATKIVRRVGDINFSRIIIESCHTFKVSIRFNHDMAAVELYREDNEILIYVRNPNEILGQNFKASDIRHAIEMLKKIYDH